MQIIFLVSLDSCLDILLCCVSTRLSQFDGSLFFRIANKPQHLLDHSFMSTYVSAKMPESKIRNNVNKSG